MEMSKQVLFDVSPRGSPEKENVTSIIDQPDNERIVTCPKEELAMGSIQNMMSLLTTDDNIHPAAGDGCMNEKLEMLTKTCEECGQNAPIPFEEFATKIPHDGRKLGEASFSEVFVIKDDSDKTNSRVLKIIPFGDSSSQPNVEAVYQELIVSKTLKGYNHFANLVEAKVVRGTYPERLLKWWDDWASAEETENQSPRCHQKDQTFMIFIQRYGGIPLENIAFENTKDAVTILRQICKAVATVERELQFEHRDLHWGNVLIDGLECTIIDFTFSRLKIGESIHFTPFLSEDYFTGNGDYQFDVYRMMKETTENDWKSFHPLTNIYWIHYLAQKFLHDVPIAKGSKSQIKKFSSRIMYYGSVEDLVKNDHLFKEADV